MKACWAYASGTDAYPLPWAYGSGTSAPAEHTHQELMRMLSIRVKNPNFKRASIPCWAYASGTDACTEHARKELMRILSVRISSLRVCSACASETKWGLARVSFETSFDSKQPKLEPKLVSALSETKRLFRLFRFYTETESFDVSIEPKQTEDQPKQFDREHILLFFTEDLGFFRFFSVFSGFFVSFCSHMNCSSLPPPPPHLVECHLSHILYVCTPLAKTSQYPLFFLFF